MPPRKRESNKACRKSDTKKGSQGAEMFVGKKSNPETRRTICVRDVVPSKGEL